jgi:hypothetical protein
MFQGSAPQQFVLKDPAPRRSMPPEFVLQGLAAQESASKESAAQDPAPQKAAKGTDVMAPARATPAPRPAAEERHVAKPASGAQASLPVSKKAARANRTAKRPTSEALNAVRKFGDSPQDIPVSAYAGNGTRARNGARLPLDIRPTSIQDVYYYSVPR